MNDAPLEDTERDGGECWPHELLDGGFTCLPPVAAKIGYLDPQCTQRVALWAWAPGPALAAEGPQQRNDFFPESYVRLFEVPATDAGLTYSAVYWRPLDGGCEAGPDEGWKPVGAEVPFSVFGELQLQLR